MPSRKLNIHALVNVNAGDDGQLLQFQVFVQDSTFIWAETAEHTMMHLNCILGLALFRHLTDNDTGLAYLCTVNNDRKLHMGGFSV